MSWTILCDFDRTISIKDVTDTLLEQYALPQWHDIEKEWEEGKIGSRECMQKQIALLRATKAQVDELADSMQVDPYFKKFAALCEARHVRLFIVSDGLDYIIKRVMTRLGLSNLPVIASHLAHTGEDRWELTAPYANAQCGAGASTCKCAASNNIRTFTHADSILYIGDGRSDYCVSMNEAELILAKDSLLTYCVENKLPHHAFKDFSEAAKLLEQIANKDRQKIPALTEEALYA